MCMCVFFLVDAGSFFLASFYLWVSLWGVIMWDMLRCWHAYVVNTTSMTYSPLFTTQNRIMSNTGFRQIVLAQDYTNTGDPCLLEKWWQTQVKVRIECFVTAKIFLRNSKTTMKPMIWDTQWQANLRWDTTFLKQLCSIWYSKKYNGMSLDRWMDGRMDGQTDRWQHDNMICPMGI